MHSLKVYATVELQDGASWEEALLQVAILITPISIAGQRFFDYLPSIHK
jgi:hypothetical protein